MPCRAPLPVQVADAVTYMNASARQFLNNTAWGLTGQPGSPQYPGAASVSVSAAAAPFLLQQPDDVGELPLWSYYLVAGVRGFSLGYQYLTPEFIREAHARLLPVFAWTADDPSDISSLIVSARAAASAGRQPGCCCVTYLCLPASPLTSPSPPHSARCCVRRFSLQDIGVDGILSNNVITVLQTEAQWVANDGGADGSNVSSRTLTIAVIVTALAGLALGAGGAFAYTHGGLCPRKRPGAAGGGAGGTGSAAGGLDYSRLPYEAPASA